MSLKIHFLHSYLIYFSSILGTENDEQLEHLQQNLITTQIRY